MLGALATYFLVFVALLFQLYTTIEYDSNSVQCHRAFESLSGWRAE